MFEQGGRIGGVCGAGGGVSISTVPVATCQPDHGQRNCRRGVSHGPKNDAAPDFVKRAPDCNKEVRNAE